jgi:hypothetical protein
MDIGLQGSTLGKPLLKATLHHMVLIIKHEANISIAI